MIAQKLRSANQRFMPGHLFHGPEWLVLGVNNTCNLHCKMCDVGVDYSQSNFYQNLVGTTPLHMPAGLFREIADQAARYFPNVKLGYAFTEPLVYSHLFETLQYAQSKGLFTSITTNALSLRKWADKLIAGGLNELYVSLDGPPDVHNKIRGYATSFERALEGMEYLFAQPNHPAISVYCVITQWNIGRLREFLEIFRKYPIREVGFMHTNYTPEHVAEAHNAKFGHVYYATASNMTDIDLSQYDLDLLWAEMKEIDATAYPFEVGFSPGVKSRESLQAFYHEPSKMFGKRCHDIFKAIMIKSNGDVIPAHGRCYNVKIGNLYESDLQAIWNSSVISSFRKTVMAEGGLLPACSRCCSAFHG